MGFFASLKGQKALNAHNRGDIAKARALYEEAMAQGCMEIRPMLGYALLLIRAEEYEKAMDLLIKAQKAKDITPDRKSQLFVDYAACCAKTGKLDKGVSLLERQHQNTPTGLTYQTLGYLYVEQMAAAMATEEGIPAEMEEKAVKMLEDAVEYDDEDPVCLDNKAQYLYRIKGDKAAAKEWFDKAHEEKPGQIDSLWFLSRYDLDNGDTAAAIEKLETALEGNFSPLNFASKADVEAELARLKA